ncbi:MAG: C1 family peptidase [Chlorobi bacterium]|nr:C1 family peptidase [Chlorobiota bacterium]
MKHITFLIAIAMFFSVIQTKAQQIDESKLQEIKDSFKNTAENRALMNAISHNDIKKLAENRNIEGKVNHFFTDEVNTKGISNQKQSGRCWLYTGLNTLKPMVQEKYSLTDFEFSQTYNFFWDQFEKANLFLEIAMETSHLPMNDKKVEWLFHNPIGDGGQWTTFADNIKKYGLVPSSAMPDTYQSEKTSMMSRLLRRKLREQGLEMRQIGNSRMSEEAKQQKKIDMLKDIYRILALSLGEPPTEFMWQYKDKDGNLSENKKYTPIGFYNEVIGLNLGDYVMLMDDPRHDYYKLYEVEYDRNLIEGGNWKYINLPADEIKKFAIKSIKSNEAMYFSCDVGKQLNLNDGTLDINNYDYNDLLGVEFNMNKKQRIETFESGSTHGMALVGVNILADGSADKWKLENSWGPDKGINGYLTMTDEWFSEYMFRLVINNKYLDSKTLKILDKKAVVLPPWDAMY